LSGAIEEQRDAGQHIAAEDAAVVVGEQIAASEGF
jgi:hypothetical protein